MSRTLVNFVVDVLALAAFVFLMATGTLMRYVLPPGSGHFATLWGMDRHDWGQIHFWIAMVLIAVMALHLFLHWRWIVGTVQGTSREGAGVRVALAIAGVLVLTGLSVTPFLAPVEFSGEPPHRMQLDEQPKDPTEQIDGSMTLQEVERRTGVPAAVIVETLGLPSDLPTDQRLGQLRKKYGFDIHDVREIVEKHRQQR
jgi:hypothetical protein